jgi:MFS family permease
MPKVSGSDSDVEKEHAIPDATGGSSTPVEKIGTFASLRIRNFRFLLVGTTLSNAAQWIQQVTLNWLVYDLTGSGIILGTINLVRSVASLGIIPLTGLLIDHLNRRRLLMIENCWLFTITFTLGLMLLLGNPHISYLFVFAFLAGMTQTVDLALRQVLVLDLVPRSHTPNALALEVFGDESGRVLGFLMASVGVGGIGGGFVTASLGCLERRGLLQLASLFLLGLSLISFAFSTTLLVALLFLALAGFFEMIFLTTNQTLLQLSIPDNLRGRVTSVVNLNMALSPPGRFSGWS